MQDHLINFSIAMQLNLGPAILLVAKGKANVFKPRRKTFTALYMTWQFFILLPSGFLLPGEAHRRGLYTFRYTHRARRRCSHTHQVTVFQRILQTEFDRVHSQFFSEFVHLHFRHEQSLRRAEPAEGSTWHVVCINTIHISFYIRDVIRASRCNSRIP